MEEETVWGRGDGVEERRRRGGGDGVEERKRRGGDGVEEETAWRRGDGVEERRRRGGGVVQANSAAPSRLKIIIIMTVIKTHGSEASRRPGQRRRDGGPGGRSHGDDPSLTS